MATLLLEERCFLTVRMVHWGYGLVLPLPFLVPSPNPLRSRRNCRTEDSKENISFIGNKSFASEDLKPSSAAQER
jgi:hypothetical protein